MITLLSLLTAAVLIGAVVLVKLFKSAPVGYQDGNGFHFEARFRIASVSDLSARRADPISTDENTRPQRTTLDPLQVQ